MQHAQSVRQLLGLLDLTSLRGDETADAVTRLCQRAHSRHGHVAAVCVFPDWVKTASQILRDSPVRTATVINFPHGTDALAQINRDAEVAWMHGADEIDLVIPYQRLKAGQPDEVIRTVASVVDRMPAHGALKCIVECGELSPEELTLAVQLCIDGGCQFVKTSTGKANINATPDAARRMLLAILNSGRTVGFKAAGGIATVAQAIEYMHIAADILGAKYLHNNTFRIGASALLDDVLQEIAHADSESD